MYRSPAGSSCHWRPCAGAAAHGEAGNGDVADNPDHGARVGLDAHVAHVDHDDLAGNTVEATEVQCPTRTA